MADPEFRLVLRDAAATEALGAALARALLQGVPASRVAYLHGELGAGKTTCVRSLLRTLGVAGPIRSPTYTLVESYQPAGMICVHVDLYRLRSVFEVDELGLADYLDGDGLLLVEWPERGGAALPPADLEVTLNYFEDCREARLLAPTLRGEEWLAMLRDDASLIRYLSNLT